jgi:hemerythrin-like domain-containing protein
MERVARAVAYVEDRRQHIESPDKSIKSCARREVKKYLDELRELGFFIPGVEPKGKA